jgi:hypothetical protein
MSSNSRGLAVPWAVANASYKRQKKNPNVTEIVEIPGRGHSLVIDDGWRDVANIALAFVNDQPVGVDDPSAPRRA